MDGACQAAVDVADPVVSKLVRKLRHFADLTDRVIAQTRRRVLEGESVPAAEKVVSIFEEHADILRKGTRETVYGHKLYLTCGKSSLITDCMLVRGNPADSGRLQSMLERQNQLYGRYPQSPGGHGRRLCLQEQPGLGQGGGAGQGHGLRQEVPSAGGGDG